MPTTYVQRASLHVRLLLSRETCCSSAADHHGCCRPQNGKRMRFILMNTGHMMAVRKISGWCCSVTKYTLSTHMVVTPDETCVAVADVTDPEARLFRVVGPSGSLSLRADDTVSVCLCVCGCGCRCSVPGRPRLRVVCGQADRDHWLRLLKKLKSKLEVMDDDYIAILRNETRLTREFLEAEWRCVCGGVLDSASTHWALTPSGVSRCG